MARSLPERSVRPRKTAIKPAAAAPAAARVATRARGESSHNRSSQAAIVRRTSIPASPQKTPAVEPLGEVAADVEGRGRGGLVDPLGDQPGRVAPLGKPAEGHAELAGIAPRGDRREPLGLGKAVAGQLDLAFLQGLAVVDQSHAGLAV